MDPINEGHERMLTAEGRSSTGVPTAIDTTNYQMKWVATPPGIVDLLPMPNTNTCRARAVAQGITTVNVTGDSDLTAGVNEIFGSIVLQVTPVASTLAVMAGPQTPVVVVTPT
jgi:hypothetical protein